MNSRDPFTPATLERAVHDCMDTARRGPLRAALEVLAVGEILKAADGFGGYEWVVILECLPSPRRREVLSLLNARQMAAVREALLTGFPAVETGESFTGCRSNLRCFLDPAPALEIGEWHRWPENVSNGRVNECAQFVYFTTTEKGRLLSRASLLELATTEVEGGLLPRMETPISAFSMTASPISAWRTLQLGGWSELPVVDENRCLVGVVYRERLARRLVLKRLLPSADSLRPGLVNRFRVLFLRARGRLNRGVSPPSDNPPRAGW